MAVTVGTNAGFVLVAPTANPNGSVTTIDGECNGTKDTTPSGAVKITEIGWWSDSIESSEANFEVGLYSDAGNDEPETLLFVSRTNAKGTAGREWKTASVDWAISASTTYWICMQLDNNDGEQGNYNSSGNVGRSRLNTPQTTLPSDWGPGDFNDSNGANSIYAVYEAAAGGINPKVKVSGAFSTKTTSVKIGGTFVEKPVLVKVGGTFQ